MSSADILHNLLQSGYVSLTFLVYSAFQLLIIVLDHRKSRAAIVYSLLLLLLSIRHGLYFTTGVFGAFGLHYQVFAIYLTYAILPGFLFSVIAITNRIKYSTNTILSIVFTGLFLVLAVIFTTESFFTALDEHNTLTTGILPPLLQLAGTLPALFLLALPSASQRSINIEPVHGGATRQYAIAAVIFFLTSGFYIISQNPVLLSLDLLGIFFLYLYVFNRSQKSPWEYFKTYLLWITVSSIPLVAGILILLLFIEPFKELYDTSVLFAAVIIYYLLLYYHRYLQKRIDNIFNRIPLHLSDELKRFQRHILSILSPEKIMVELYEVIRKNFKTSGSYILLWNEVDGYFEPYGWQNPPDRLKFRVYHEFFLYMGEIDEILFAEELISFSETRRYGAGAREFLERTGAHLIVPLILNRSILAVLVLSKKVNGGGYSVAEINFLNEIRTTATLVISNALLYERLSGLNENLELKVKERTRELENTQAQMLQNEKLASLGVMVAGIAHEINTPIGVINGAVENISRNLPLLFNKMIETERIHAPAEEKESIEALQFFSQRFFDESADNKTSHLSSSEKFKATREITDYLKNNFDLNDNQTRQRARFLTDYGFSFENKEAVKKMGMFTDIHFDLVQKMTLFRQNIQNMFFSITNIVRIVKALKYYSHLDQSHQEIIQPAEGLDNTLIILHNQLKHGIDIEKDYESVSGVLCNPGELNQIWTNLINNAAQAMNYKGSLKLKVFEKNFSKKPEPGSVFSAKDIENLHSRAKDSHKYVGISIEDSGEGISEVNLNKIFDPFFTTKAPGQGTGLGLGIVRNILKKTEGFIVVTSAPGSTNFTVFLPAAV